MKMPSRNRARSIEELRKIGIDSPAQAPGLVARTGPRPRRSARAHAGYAGSVARLGGQGTRVSVAVILGALAGGMEVQMAASKSPGAGGCAGGDRVCGQGSCFKSYLI